MLCRGPRLAAGRLLRRQGRDLPLEPLNPSQQRLGIQLGFRARQANDGHLQRQLRLGRIAHVRFRCTQGLDGPQDQRYRQGHRLPAEGLAFLGARQHRRTHGLLAGHLKQKHVPQIPGGVPQKLAQVPARFLQFFHQSEPPGRVAGGQHVGERDHLLPGGDPQHARDHVGRDLLRVCPALVQKPQPIAEAPLGVAGDDPQRVLGDVDAFRLGHLRQPGDGFRHGQAAEVEPLATGSDRRGNLVGFGRGEHEHHMLRRLLKHLQQRIEGLVGQHVNFVDDVDLVGAFGGRKAHPFPDFPDLVDAPVGRAVDLDDVHGGTLGDAPARRALVARLGRGPLDAVEPLRQQPRQRRLARAPWAREKVRVGDALLRQGVGERAHDVGLPGHVGKGLRAPLAVEGDVAHRGYLPAGSLNASSTRRRLPCARSNGKPRLESPAAWAKPPACQGEGGQ